MHDRRSTMRYAGSAAWTRDTMLCSLPPHGRPTNQCVKRGETRLWAQPSRGREVEHLNKLNGSQPYQITDGMGQIGVTQCYIVHIGFTVEFYSIVQIVVGVGMYAGQTRWWELPSAGNLGGCFVFS